MNKEQLIKEVTKEIEMLQEKMAMLQSTISWKMKLLESLEMTGHSEVKKTRISPEAKIENALAAIGYPATAKQIALQMAKDFGGEQSSHQVSFSKHWESSGISVCTDFKAERNATLYSCVFWYSGKSLKEEIRHKAIVNGLVPC